MAEELSELEKLKQQAEEYLSNWKRERADFVNYKKAETKRLEEFVKFANVGLILEAIEILDDLEITSRHSQDEELSRVLKKFQELLAKYGVERIKTDEKFDPALHEAIENGEGDNIEEIRAGYTLNEKVIRPTRVKLVK